MSWIPISGFGRGCLVALALAGVASAQSSRPGWGAVPYAGGVTFRTFAPHAASVSVAGSFNGWSTTSLPLAAEGDGVWSRDVAGAAVGQPYKLVINGNLWRRDPYGRRLEAGGTRNSLITDPASFDWGDDAFTLPPTEELVIYEMHLGTFHDPVPGDAQRGTFATAIERLDHLRDLGVNAVELMPISDFPSATSWGYNLSYPFAIETDYGTPDDARAFVRACHERGIAVLMDVVHNHWGGDDNDWSLWQYDGWSSNGLGGVFFYNDPVYADTGWGPRPDYSRPQVRAYIADNFRMWKEEYRIDGFRWDAPKYILYTDGTQAVPVPDGSNLINEVIGLLSAEYPGTFNIAEDIKGVAGFDSHWDLGFQWQLQDLMAQGSDASRNLFTLASLIDADARRIVFTESHDSTGDLNNGQRLPVRVDGANPEGYWARKRTLLAAALTFTTPGTPMIWQGQELYETNVFSDTRALDWSRTNRFPEFTRIYRDLIRLRRNLDGVSPGLLGDQTAFSLLDNNNKLLAYRRTTLAQPDEAVVVLANLSSTVRSNLVVTLPRAGDWYVHVNTDDPRYGADFDGVGPARVTAAGSTPTASVDLGRYSALILSQRPVSALVLDGLDWADGPVGNGNGVAEPGETVAVGVRLRNAGQTAIADAVVRLVAEAPLTVGVERVDFGAIAAGAVATGGSALAWSVPADWPCGQAAALAVVIEHAGSTQRVAVTRAVGEALVLDAATNRFDSVEVPRAIVDVQTVDSTVTLPGAVDARIEAVRVLVRIDHTWDGDLTLRLAHPDGTEVVLANRRGSYRNHFGSGACGGGVVYTVFDDGAAASIAEGTAPFAGSFRPESPLAVFRGKPPGGVWTLRIDDAFNGDEGTLLCWSLEVAQARRVSQCETWFGINPDRDGDGVPDADEVRAGTNPDDAGSYLRFAAGYGPGGDDAGEAGRVLQWPSVSGVTYRIWHSERLIDPAFTVRWTNLPATPAVNTITDTTATAESGFYVIEVE